MPKIQWTPCLARRERALFQRGLIRASEPWGGEVRVEVDVGGVMSQDTARLTASGAHSFFFAVPEGQNSADARVTLRAEGQSAQISLPWAMPRPRTVCFVPITHHDLGYTQSIDRLLKDYARYYESVLDFCDATDAYPEAAQYRYTVEQFWSLDYFLHHTAPENVRRLVRRVRQGRVEVSGTYANIIDGIVSDDELKRLFAPSRDFAKRCGVGIETVSQVDMPGMSSAMISAVAASGASLFAGFPKYFQWHPDVADGKRASRSYWDERALFGWGHPAAFRWKAAADDDLSAFVWYQSGYGWFGDDEHACIETDDYATVDAYLPGFLSDLDERGVPYSVMRYIDHGSDNQPPQRAISDIVRKWNETYETPVLRVATNRDFFALLREDCSGLRLPVVSGELPHTDYSLLSLSEAEHTAMNARTKLRLSAAERLRAALGLQTDAEAIWKNVMLYDEHCFGMSVPYGPLFRLNRAIKMEYALRAARECDDLTAETLRAASADTLRVFNPADVTADGVVCLFGAALPEMCMLRDARSGEMWPVQRDDESDPAALPMDSAADEDARRKIGERRGRYTLRVGGIPPRSMATYEIVPMVPREGARGGDLESPFYRIQLDDGGRIQSLFDREAGRELLSQQSALALGTVFLRHSDNSRIAPMSVLKRRLSRRGPVAVSLLTTAMIEDRAWIHTEVTLYQTLKRVDIDVSVSQSPHAGQEIWMALPFRGERPAYRYRAVNRMVCFPRDILPGANTHQITFRGWCGFDDEAGGVVLASQEATVASFGAMHPSSVSYAHHAVTPEGYFDPYERRASGGEIYLMLAYNNCRTNFSAAQQGTASYHLSLTSGRKALAGEGNPDEAASWAAWAQAFCDRVDFPPILIPENGGK